MQTTRCINCTSACVLLRVIYGLSVRIGSNNNVTSVRFNCIRYCSVYSRMLDEPKLLNPQGQRGTIQLVTLTTIHHEGKGWKGR